jgi:hypothetical protein
MTSHALYLKPFCFWELFFTMQMFLSGFYSWQYWYWNTVIITVSIKPKKNWNNPQVPDFCSIYFLEYNIKTKIRFSWAFCDKLFFLSITNISTTVIRIAYYFLQTYPGIWAFRFPHFLFDCPLEWCARRFIDSGSILRQSVRDLWWGKWQIWQGFLWELRVSRVSNLSIPSPYLFIHCPGDSSGPTGGSIYTKAYSRHPPPPHNLLE